MKWFPNSSGIIHEHPPELASNVDQSKTEHSSSKCLTWMFFERLVNFPQKRLAQIVVRK